VIERGRGPARRGVARSAVRGAESGARRRMDGIVRPLPGSQVALGIAAIGRGDRQRVVIVDVAEGASHVRMPVREQESRCAMVEDACGPRGDRVAGGAGGSRGREPCRHVIGNVPADRRRALKRRRVAAVTIRRTERVIVIDMAGRARGRGVRSDQSKSGYAVVERRRRPAGRRVAIGAIGGAKRGARSRVHGSRRLLPGRQVALRISAVGRRNRQCVIIVNVALRALQIGVAQSQIEPGRAVIGEGSIIPCDRQRGVARGASLYRKPTCVSRMSRVGGLLPGRQMATRVPAIVLCDARQIVVVADVA
jgi:hypothetical protein